MFSQKSKILLEKMRIDAEDYYQSLVDEFGNDVQVFCELIDEFECIQKFTVPDAFIEFWNSKFPTYKDDGKLFNWAYEFYNNLERYFSGGVFELFKYKQAEWGAPIIRIHREDVPSSSNIDELDENVEIYRGLSKLEHERCEYAQSWTIDYSIAKRFATTIYSDEIPGIIVKAIISKDKILFYDKTCSEQEIITEVGAVVSATEID
jgi:hypothetical protein